MRLTGGEHALNEVADVAQDKPVPFRSSFSRRTKDLDLYTLTYWYRKLALKAIWGIEDGTKLR
jgi:hypothetical protein